MFSFNTGLKKGEVAATIVFTVLLVDSLTMLVLDITYFAYNNVGFTLFVWVYIKKHFPVNLVCLVFVTALTRSTCRKVDWKIMVAPALVAAGYAVFNWQFSRSRNYFSVSGLNWQYAALFEWNLLFILSVFLFSKKNVDAITVFTLSYFNMYLGGILYEVPWFIASGQWVNHVHNEVNWMVVACYVFLLYRIKWRFTRFMIPTILFLFGMYLPYYLWPPDFYWVPRLAVYPLFLMVPFSLKKDC